VLGIIGNANSGNIAFKANPFMIFCVTENLRENSDKHYEAGKALFQFHPNIHAVHGIFYTIGRE